MPGVQLGALWLSLRLLLVATGSGMTTRQLRLALYGPTIATGFDAEVAAQGGCNAAQPDLMGSEEGGVRAEGVVKANLLDTAGAHVSAIANRLDAMLPMSAGARTASSLALWFLGAITTMWSCGALLARVIRSHTRYRLVLGESSAWQPFVRLDLLDSHHHESAPTGSTAIPLHSPMRSRAVKAAESYADSLVEQHSPTLLVVNI